MEGTIASSTKSQTERARPFEDTRHILSVKDMSLEVLCSLLRGAAEMEKLVNEKGGDERLKHKVLGSAFFEASTRTSCSFSAAMLRLGGDVITFNDEKSSTKKGESLEDTIRTLSAYCDGIVLRHGTNGAADLAASVSCKPIISAGDGSGEHPTQALLDVFTILTELGRVGSWKPSIPSLPSHSPLSVSTSVSESTSVSVSEDANVCQDHSKDKQSKSVEVEVDPMVITLCGDLLHSRTVHSLVHLLALFPHVHLQVSLSPSPSLSLSL